MADVIVVDYDPAWPQMFEALRERIWPSISDVATSIEHVGSTSVPGLAAKPVIDMTIVVPDSKAMPIVIERLAALGYTHRGDLGIAGREAFAAPEANNRKGVKTRFSAASELMDSEQIPADCEIAKPGFRAVCRHHLYACIEGAASLRNHLCVRDRLREDAELARAYGALKQRLAQEYPNDIDGYIDGKTEFLVALLADDEFSSDELSAIDAANRKPE